VAALDDLWLAVAAVIHDGVVQAAKTRAGVEGRILNAEGLQEIDDDIGAVLGA
jgi:hypothetical protein